MTSNAMQPEPRTTRPSDTPREAAVCAAPAWGVAAHAASARRLILTLSFTIFLCMLPVTMLVPVLRELLTLRFSAGSFWTHAFMSVNLVGGLIAAPLGAWLSDRCPARRTIFVAALGLDALLLAGMYALARWEPSLPALMAVRFLEGAAHITALSALMALAGDWAGPGRAGRIMGVVGASLVFGTAFGTPLGGRIGQADPLLVLLLGAGISLIASLAGLCTREAPSRRSGSTLGDTMFLLHRRPQLATAFLYAFIERLCVGVIVTTFILYLGEVHFMDPARKGLLMALFLFPFALLCYPMGRLVDRRGRIVPMTAGGIGFGLVYAAYGLVPPTVLPVLMVASGILSAVMFAPNLALCADLAPQEQRGAAFAGFNMAGSLGFLCGPLLGGTLMWMLTPRYGVQTAYPATFAATGLLVVICALLSIPWLVSLKRGGATT